MSLYGIGLEHWKWVEAMGWHTTSQLEKMALVASEVGEAVNELRGEVPTEKYKYELADIVLRVLDAAEEAGIDMDHAVYEKMEMNKARGSKGRTK
jgi:NTP pyrophosphatase (non-canonical NTP hydrolase)